MKRLQFAITLATVFTLSAASPAAADPDDDSKFGAWSTPTNIGAMINSTFNEFGPGLSPDGKSLYFTSNRPGGFGQADLWVAQRTNKNASWGTPVNLGPTLNTAAVEAVPSFSRDGRWMFFNSDRASGFGMNDVWVSFRVNPNDDFGWQSPMNLGSVINSAAFDAGATLVHEGEAETLYFNSNRSGNQEFYASARRKDGSFGTPALVTALNSTGNDNRLTFRRDRQEVFFFSDRPGSTGTDLWTSVRDDRDAGWGAPTLVSVLNSAANELQATLSRDGRTLIFASDRSGGFGGADLYVATRPKGGG